MLPSTVDNIKQEQEKISVSKIIPRNCSISAAVVFSVFLSFCIGYKLD